MLSLHSDRLRKKKYLLWAIGVCEIMVTILNTRQGSVTTFTISNAHTACPTKPDFVSLLVCPVFNTLAEYPLPSLY